MFGLRPSAIAEAFTRLAWRSRSGATPSNQRAPSNTLVPSHMAWLRGPRMATLPSYQSPSTKVHVADCAVAASVIALSRSDQSCVTTLDDALAGIKEFC